MILFIDRQIWKSEYECKGHASPLRHCVLRSQFIVSELSLSLVYWLQSLALLVVSEKMGCDGGTIPRRDEMVKLKKKAEKVSCLVLPVSTQNVHVSKRLESRCSESLMNTLCLHSESHITRKEVLSCDVGLACEANIVLSSWPQFYTGKFLISLWRVKNCMVQELITVTFSQSLT